MTKTASHVDYRLDPPDLPDSVLHTLPSWLFNEYAGDFLREKFTYGSDTLSEEEFEGWVRGKQGEGEFDD